MGTERDRQKEERERRRERERERERERFSRGEERYGWERREIESRREILH